MESKPHTYVLQDFFIFIFLCLFFFIYYYKQLPVWWISSDDPAILKHAVQYSFWEFFSAPSVWRELSSNNFTPIVSVLYKADFLLFGLNPHSFYLHHLFMLCISVGISYFFLRIWLPAVWAVSGSCMYALSACFVSNMHHLMTRHYVEGLIWTLVSLIFYHFSIEKKKIQCACLGAFFYLLAILNKEIYAPMIILLPFWPDKSEKKESSFLQERFLYILPFLIVAICYPFYRKWMIGDWIGGYGDLYSVAYDFKSAWGNIENQILQGKFWLLFIIFSILFIGTVDNGKNLKKRIGFLFIIAIAVVSPLVSILQILAPRHLFLPMFMLGGWLSIALHSFSKKGKYAYTVSLFCTLLLIYNFFHIGRQKQCSLKKTVTTYTVQGNFLWNDATDKDVILTIGMPSWYTDNLLWMNRFVRNRQQNGKVITDLCFKTYTNPMLKTDLNYWKYDQEKQKMIRIPYEQIEKETKGCMTFYRKNISLTAHLFQDRHLVRWELGPYKAGQYYLTFSENGSFIPLPPKGSCPVVLDTVIGEENDLFVCFAHPDNWKACTKLDIVNGELFSENR